MQAAAEISRRKGQRYLTVVVDHDTGRLIWAATGRDKRTVEAFLDELGKKRCLELDRQEGKLAQIGRTDQPLYGPTCSKSSCARSTGCPPRRRSGCSSAGCSGRGAPGSLRSSSSPRRSHRAASGDRRRDPPRPLQHPGRGDQYADPVDRPPGNHGGRANYAPNSFDDPPADGTWDESSPEVAGPIGRFDYEQRYNDTDSGQPAAFWAMLDDGERERLVGNIAGHLGEVTHEDIRRRSLEYLAIASQDLSDRVGEAMEAPSEVGSPTA